MKRILWLTALLPVACYISPGTPPVKECESSVCGCAEKKHMVFTGYVTDGTTGECIPFKLVRLRNLDGTVLAEDRSKSFGSYRLESDTVDRYPRCPAGEPVIRDDPDPGQSLPTYTYLPRRTPVSDEAENVDLFRFPYGTVDAGSGLPSQCTAPHVDAGFGHLDAAQIDAAARADAARSDAR